MTLVSLSYQDPETNLTNAGNLSVFNNVTGNTIQLVQQNQYSIKDQNGYTITQNSAYATIANVTAGGVTAQSINAQDLILVGQSVNDRLNNLEIEASDEA